MESESLEQDASVSKTLERFFESFENLDWDSFCSFFAEDATGFHPRGNPERATGRAEVEASFRPVFQKLRENRTMPPFHDIRPRSLQVQVLGEVAIATFHLDDQPGQVNRRTLVLTRNEGTWKIIHLHASEVAIPEPASA